MTYVRLGNVIKALYTLQISFKFGKKILVAHTIQGICFETLGMTPLAELSYATAVNVSLEHCDSWIALASLIGTSRGEISNAVHIIRGAYSGGPEAKFKEPQKHPVLAILLAYFLDALGHDAEPAALFDFSLRSGGGVTPLFFQAAVGVTSGDIDTDMFYAYRNAFEAARNEARKSTQNATLIFYASIELVNQKSIPAQWKKVQDKMHCYEEILKLLRFIAPKMLYTT